ncbi:MAG: bifunctional glutamate N-acetyltransferase/amino-acid acetyltransferase ArgJ [Bryobacteraceae bacterium]
MKLPLGYRYSSLYAGIRKDQRDDLALIVSDEPASAAALFTTNRVQAAPVKLSRRHLRDSRGKVKALLINAGNANCATRTGDKVALATSKALARNLKVPVEQVLPSSTGVIGVELDGNLILNNLPVLVDRLAEEGFDCVARAIMTTDLVPKTAFAQVKLKAGAVRIAGMTKGSGMIHPLLATTLGYVMTDAAISPAHLKPMLRRAADRSYNRLSVDGDTSTNDTVVVLANGAAGIKPNEKERRKVEEALIGVMEDLASQIARDGEGAEKLITIEVTGAKNDEAAAKIARQIANSPLVKTAIAGSDANWGRILSAAGNAGVEFDPGAADIYMQDVLVCKRGLAAGFSEPELKKKLDERDCRIRFAISGKGKGTARFFTCDFTEGYIRINASYRT